MSLRSTQSNDIRQPSGSWVSLGQKYRQVGSTREAPCLSTTEPLTRTVVGAGVGAAVAAPAATSIRQASAAQASDRAAFRPPRFTRIWSHARLARALRAT